MKKVLLFCLLCILLPSVHGAANITCASCDLGHTKCADKNCTMNSCVTLTESDTLGGASTTRTYRGCLDQCKPRAFTLTTTAGRRVQTSTACCASDKCNELLTLSVPPVGASENGVHCPSCENYNRSQCGSKGSVACTGIEVKCIALAGLSTVDQIQNFSIRGCASQNACDLGPDDLVAYGGKVYKLTVKAVCTDAGTLAAISSPATFLTAIVGFFLVNVLS